MELEDMKTTWSEMDDRLRKQEILNEKLVKEMLRDRSQRSINKLTNWEASGVLSMLIFIPALIIFMIYARPILMKVPVLNYWMIVCVILCVLALIWQVFKVAELLRIDVAADIKDNLKRINRYKLCKQREKTVMYIYLLIVTLAGIGLYAFLSVPLWAWIFMGSVILGCTLSMVYAYKKLYDKNIASIQRSLDELKDLEE